MSALTLADIRGEVRFKGDYQNLRKFPNTDVDKVIQRQFDNFWRLVEETNQGWWDTEGTITTVANQAYVALLADTWLVKAMDRSDSDGWVEMSQVGLNQRNRYANVTGKPLSFRLTSRGAELYPTPDMAYTLRQTYTPKPPKLAESQPRDYYTGWEDYLITGTLLELDTRERRPLGDRLTAFQLAEKNLKAGASQRRQQEPEYLRLREFDDYDPYKDGLY